MYNNHKQHNLPQVCLVTTEIKGRPVLEINPSINKRYIKKYNPKKEFVTQFMLTLTISNIISNQLLLN